MTTKPVKRRDFTQVAFAVAQIATGEAPKPQPLTGKKADSRKGGLKGGKARAEKLAPKIRTEIAKKAAKVRWNKPIVAKKEVKKVDLLESTEIEPHS